MQRSLKVFENMAYSYVRCLLAVVTLSKHLVVAFQHHCAAKRETNFWPQHALGKTHSLRCGRLCTCGGKKDALGEGPQLAWLSGNLWKPGECKSTK